MNYVPDHYNLVKTRVPLDKLAQMLSSQLV